MESEKIIKFFSLLRRMRESASEIACSSALKMLAILWHFELLNTNRWLEYDLKRTLYQRSIWANGISVLCVVTAHDTIQRNNTL